MNAQQKWIAGAVGGLTLLMLATNPDQAAHLQAIKNTAALAPSSTTMTAASMASLISYNNNLLFSTTTLFDHTVSWGAFGKVHTTNRVSDPAGIRK